MIFSQTMPQKNQFTKRSILTQNKLLAAREIRLHWIFVAFLLPIMILIATLSAAPDSEAGYLPVRITIDDIRLPPIVQPHNPNEAFWHTDQVRHNDTLDVIFNRMTIQDKSALKFLMYTPETRELNTRLVPGRSIGSKVNAEGKLLYLEYQLPDDERLVAKLTNDGYQVNKEKTPFIKQEILRSATIVSSLFGATDAADIPDQVALKIVDIFSSEIDFNEDLRPGDTINVVYEGFYNHGEFMRTGDILAVEIVNGGKTHRAVHFGKASSKYAYYTPEGKSLYKSFLRSPLEFTRVSSSFSRGRFHPVLHRVRAHKGVDLAARSGTRIKASGDAVVKFKGKKGGYGNVIVLQHPNGIQTVYGHLSGFADGLSKGKKIEQGDIIGYVGMSGLATGPHLHYEFLLNGIHHDPMTVKLPKGVTLEAQYQQEFKSNASRYMAKINMLNRNTVIASQ
jgi:murein DD-endopeptidase MepM/ murein hydrolase activator NlpD